MNIKEFSMSIMDAVKENLGAKYDAKIDSVMKNNGVILTGVLITEDGNNVSPMIYLNSYFSMYERGEIDFDGCVNSVIKAYFENRERNINISDFTDYESVKDKIVLKLISREKNEELLQEVPNVDFLDLSIVFQIVVSAKEIGGNATILIRNGYMETLGVSKEKLYITAMENTQRIYPHSIESMFSVLTEMEPEIDDVGNVGNGMYVLSNKARINGAACILYPDVLRNFSEKVNSSFYIIPSSIHEVLLLPTNDTENHEEIKEMVREVNDTQVSEDEILSYSLYYYNKENDNIEIF